MSEQFRVKLNLTAMHAMGLMSGLGAAKDALEGLPEPARRTPGMALAIAAVSAEFYQIRAEVVQRNMAAIAKAGHDVSLHKDISYDPSTGELLCTFYEDAEE